MSDNDWLPNEANPHLIPMGLHNGRTGERVSGPMAPRSRNSLMGSDNEIVANIGQWLFECPLDIENSAAAYMGIIHGIRFALNHPNLARVALREMVTRARNKEVPVDEALDNLNETVDYWLTGEFEG